MKQSDFTPKLISILKGGLKREQLLKDLSAGLIVGIVALPLAIAFAIASGVSPDKGLVTAIIAGIIISALGGSRVQIGGPTGAFIVIVYAIVQEHGIGGLTIATFMAGLILVLMGLARLGSLLKYIPYPLIVGFTSGIAVIIFSSQINDFFGLSIQNLPADFLGKWLAYGQHLSQINWYAVIIAIATILLSLNFHRISTKVPGSLVAIIAGTVVVHLFNVPVTTIESSFGDIPSRIPVPMVPDVNFSTVKALIQPALAIALLGGIESLLSAVVADGMIGGRHRSNMELIAQGVANCFSAMFGGIPATGAIARTATNVKNGGRTPIAGITHAIVLLLIMMLLAPFAKLIPMACLAGILIVVSYHMSEWRHFVFLLKGNRLDILILLVTFFLTVIFDLVIAIEVGVVLSSFTVMKRLSESVSIKVFSKQAETDDELLFEEEIPELPSGVVLYEVNGALFFGAAQTFQDALNRMQQRPEVLILRMRHVPFIDATGIHRLKEVIREFRSQEVQVILSGVSREIVLELEKADIHSLLENENIIDHIEASLARAKVLIKSS
ncbi:SulP family inorganic anion transporter [Croceimicrobium sp.]|uniref:SulP family inorganic anion transporter n=1 Tax=Croceimicrobium sp. TaxID=2828340 RepID=UPI003BAD9504